MDGIKIVDTTLRDGEQTPGVAFSKAEKLRIAYLLDKAGVDEIEVGIPAMGGCEQDSIRAIVKANLRAKVLTWNRMVLSDIKASIDCKVNFVHISAPVSDIHLKYKLGRSQAWVLETLQQAIAYAKDHGCEVSVGAEDASRAEQEYLLEFARVAQAAGAIRLRYADTLGILDPFNTVERLQFLTNNIELPIEMHAHDDFGMALANSVAAMHAGAQFVSTTVTGIGERAGNASLLDLVLILQKLYGRNTRLDYPLLHRLGQYVDRASGYRRTS